MQHHSNYACHSFSAPKKNLCDYYIIIENILLTHSVFLSPTKTQSIKKKVNKFVFRLLYCSPLLVLDINKEINKKAANLHKFHSDSWPTNTA